MSKGSHNYRIFMNEETNPFDGADNEATNGLSPDLVIVDELKSAQTAVGKVEVNPVAVMYPELFENGKYPDQYAIYLCLFKDLGDHKLIAIQLEEWGASESDIKAAYAEFIDRAEPAPIEDEVRPPSTETELVSTYLGINSKGEDLYQHDGKRFIEKDCPNGVELGKKPIPKS